MAGKNKKVKQKKNSQTKGKGTIIDTSLKRPDYNEMYGRIAFTNVSHHKSCNISTWHDTELKLLIECFKKIEALKWKDIFKDSGLNWERNSNIAIQLPSGLPEDSKLHSVRVDGKKRIYGYRVQEYFYIIWFDRNHIVCPENKPKKYPA